VRCAPEESIIHYVHAQHCCLTGHVADAIASLQEAILLEEQQYRAGIVTVPLLFARAGKDEVFSGITAQVRRLREAILAGLRARAEARRGAVRAFFEEIVPTLPSGAGSVAALRRRWAVLDAGVPATGYLDSLDHDLSVVRFIEELAPEAARIAAMIRGRHQQASGLAVEFVGWITAAMGFAVSFVTVALLETFRPGTPLNVVLFVEACAVPWIFFLAAPFLNRRYKKARFVSLDRQRGYWQSIEDAIEQWKRDTARPDRAAASGGAASVISAVQVPGKFQSGLPWLPVGVAVGIMIVTAILAVSNARR
jgi:hypothetical protein